MRIEEIISNEHNTKFRSYLEARTYMDIIGAKINDEKKEFILDGRRCSFWEEYNGILFEEDIPPKVQAALRSCGNHFDGRTIMDLESLLLMHEILRNKNPEETLEDTIFKTKRQMLLRIIGKQETFFLHSDEILRNFDEATIPFIHPDFNIDKFVRECIFNSPGFCEIEGKVEFNFGWTSKRKPGIYYYYSSREGESYMISISKRSIGKSSISLIHFASPENPDGCLTLFDEDNTRRDLNLKSKSFKKSNEDERQATEEEISYMFGAAQELCSLGDNYRVVRVDQIGAATVNASTRAKQEAEAVEHKETILKLGKEGEITQNGN